MYYLKFSSKDEFERAKQLFTVDGQYMPATEDWVIDEIGTIYKEPEPIPGYHINIIIDQLPVELVAKQVFPDSPTRTFL